MQCRITFIVARVTILNHPDILDLAELLECFPEIILLETLVADDEEARIRRIIVLRTQIRLRIIIPFPVVGHFPNVNASAAASADYLPRQTAANAAISYTAPLSRLSGLLRHRPDDRLTPRCAMILRRRVGGVPLPPPPCPAA